MRAIKSAPAKPHRKQAVKPLSRRDDATIRGLVLAAAILKAPHRADQLVRRYARAYLPT